MMEKVFPRQADVMTVNEWAEKVGRAIDVEFMPLPSSPLYFGAETGQF
jgi:hypothetical protein